MIKLIEKSDRGYKFCIKTESGQPLLNSVLFSDEDEMKRTVNQLGKAKRGRSRFERKTNNEGKFLFGVKNEAGKLIGFSELYSSEAGMENGIKDFRNRITSLERQGKLQTL